MNVPGGPAWLAAICVSRIGAYVAFIAYPAAIPILQREWSMSATAAGSIAGSFQIAYAVSLMGCSALADRVGARRVFVAGTVASAVAAALFALLARGYWSGLALNSVLALALGGTYTTGVLLLAENVPVVRRGRAMGLFLGGHSLGLAVGLALTGWALPRGGYPLAFALTAVGPIVGCVVSMWALRTTPNRVAGRAGGERFRGAVLTNRPALWVIAGYAFHSWELLGMWAWTPAFLAACVVAGGAGFDRAAGLGPYLTSSFHLTGGIACLLAGAAADRWGRTPVIFLLAAASTVCSFAFGGLIGAPLGVVVAVGLVYGFSAHGDSPIYSTAITEVVPPPYRGAALAVRSMAGYGAGAAAPVLFGAILDWRGGPGAGAGAWGWAFASLGVAGAIAVVSVVALHRLPEARPLTVGQSRPAVDPTWRGRHP